MQTDLHSMKRIGWSLQMQTDSSLPMQIHSNLLKPIGSNSPMLIDLHSLKQIDWSWLMQTGLSLQMLTG